ncbi:MAG: hypothetical protein H3Z54_09615 [archaeon]|nr:hypothetical protein [archaeon]
MPKPLNSRLAKVELKLVSLRIVCNCGKDFIAEDFEPECPYCGKKYNLQIHGSVKGIELKITQVRKEEWVKPKN